VEAIVVDPSPARRAALAGLGARTVLDPSACDVVAAIRDLTGGRGADASIDAARASYRSGLSSRIAPTLPWLTSTPRRRRT